MSASKLILTLNKMIALNELSFSVLRNYFYPYFKRVSFRFFKNIFVLVFGTFFLELVGWQLSNCKRLILPFFVDFTFKIKSLFIA